MSRGQKGDTDSAISLVLWVLLLIPVAAYFLIKWTVLAIGKLITAVQSLCRSNQEKKRLSEARHTQGKQAAQSPGNAGKQLTRADTDAFVCSVARLLRRCGYRDVAPTPADGDSGVDITAERDGVRYALLCRDYPSDIGVYAVRSIHAGAERYHADAAVVVTNAGFTPYAAAAAEELGVALWDGALLEQMREAASAPRAPIVPFQVKSLRPSAAVPPRAGGRREPPPENARQEKAKNPMAEENVEMAAVLRAGRYVFGKNIPNGMYDLFVQKGTAYLTVIPRDPKDDEVYLPLGLDAGEDQVREYRGIDSDDAKCFLLEGNVEVRIEKSQMILI